MKTGIRIAGADHTDNNVVVWSGKKAEIYEIQAGSCRYVCSFQKVTNLIGMKGENLYALVGPRVEVCNLQGTVKFTLAFTDAEGEPATLDIMGSFLVVGTSTGIIKMWDISRREPRQIMGTGKQFADKAGKSLGTIESVRVNADGTRVSVLSSVKGSGSSSSSIPSTKLHVWFAGAFPYKM